MLEEARQLAVRGSLIPGGSSYVEQLQRFKAQCMAAGIQHSFFFGFASAGYLAARIRWLQTSSATYAQMCSARQSRGSRDRISSSRFLDRLITIRSCKRDTVRLPVVV